MNDLAEAVRRGVIAMVQQMGGDEVQVRVPVPPVMGEDVEVLGMGTPRFQMMRVAPAVVRRDAKDVQVLVAAGVLEQVLGVRGLGAVRASLQAAADVLVGDEVWLLTGVDAVEIAGAACLYRVTLRQKGAEGLL
jgi:hypothetical protein